MKTGKSSSRARGWQWNFAGWFGTQIGSTGWLLVLGVLLLLQKDNVAGISIIVCFAVINFTGIYLWKRRDKITPYTAIQLFLALAGGLSAVTLTVIDKTGYFPQGVTANYYTKWLLIVPVLMVLFYIRQRPRK